MGRLPERLPARPGSGKTAKPDALVDGSMSSKKGFGGVPRQYDAICLTILACGSFGVGLPISSISFDIYRFLSFDSKYKTPSSRNPCTVIPAGGFEY